MFSTFPEIFYGGDLNNGHVWYSDNGHVSNNGIVCYSDHHLKNRQNVLYLNDQNPKLCKIMQPRDLNNRLLLVRYLNGSIIEGLLFRSLLYWEE
jgi:hypothetical protein